MSILYLGLDVHKDSITLAVFGPTGTEPLCLERLPYDLHKLRRFLERLTRGGEQIRACYEASGAGYVLQRELERWGYACDLIAPSLIPTRPGEQRKHDKRDAIQLGRLYRAGELVVIRVPSEAEERVRDLVRCRETFQREILKSRHYILKFLRRRGFVYRDGSHWTTRHLEWIRHLLTQDQLAAEDHIVLSEYLALLEYKLSRREELDRRIEALALEPAYRPAVERLQCFRGISTHAAMVLATEIGDWRRFQSPRQMMAYLGLVPSEHSSGERRRQGAITKAGNSHCRHVLIQAAWSYRRPPTLSLPLKRRQQGQSPQVIAHAWKAQQRLYKLFCRIGARKCAPIAATAAARELIGFLWAVMQEVPQEVESSVQHGAAA
jgi:transposase